MSAPPGYGRSRRVERQIDVRLTRRESISGWASSSRKLYDYECRGSTDWWLCVTGSRPPINTHARVEGERNPSTQITWR